MADMVKEQTTGTAAPGNADTLRNVSEQAAGAGQAAKDKLSQAADDAADMVNETREKFAARAQEFAENVKDKVGDTIESQKDAGAAYASRVAVAMRRAAHEFDQEVPIAARYIRVAADNVEGYAEQFRSGELNDVVEGVKSFARRQPTAFLGLTFLAGFGLVRLLRTSSAGSTARSRPR